MCYTCRKKQSGCCRRGKNNSAEKLNLIIQYLIEKVDYLEELIEQLHAEDEDIETVTFSGHDTCSECKPSKCRSGNNHSSKNNNSSHRNGCHCNQCNNEG